MNKPLSKTIQNIACKIKLKFAGEMKKNYFEKMPFKAMDCKVQNIFRTKMG